MVFKLKNINFTIYLHPLDIKNVNFNKAISNKISFDKKGLKYFIGYKDDEKAYPLCLMLP